MRAVIMHSLVSVQDDMPIYEIVRLIERDLIGQAVYRSGNNLTIAAHKLGLARTTLVMKIKSLVNPAKRYQKVRHEGV